MIGKVARETGRPNAEKNASFAVGFKIQPGIVLLTNDYMHTTIPFRVVELEPDSFHLVVEGSINGKSVHLIVDTGASRSLIDLSYDSGLRVDGVDDTLAVGFNTDKISIQLAIFPRVSIGELTLSDFIAAVTDLNALRSLYSKVAGMDIAGLLGCDFLVRYTSSVNFRTKRIYLKQSALEVKSESRK